MKFLVVALIAISFALPTFGMTYKTNYSVACTELWGAVKDTLNNPDNYSIQTSDDAQMTAAYDVKHAAHVNVSGAILQRTNHVKLVTKGTECDASRVELQRMGAQRQG
jgi:hypothetical protein